MAYDEEIQRLLLNLIRSGLLRIRAFASDDNAHQCFVEAHHIHNLPALVRNPRLELLTYYFDVERPAFAKLASDSDEFEPVWLRLGQLISEMRASAVQQSGG
jgi:hypothetical protein